jgi:mono/diheme cytochrome c family protein
MRRALAIALLMMGAARADERALVVNDCLQCHTDELLAQQRLSAKQWAAVVKKMIGWGAPVEPENVDALVGYLAARYATSSPPYVVPGIDAATAEASLAPQPDGKLGGGDAKRGKSLYQTACAGCHGADGRGSPTGINLADRPALWRAADFAAVVRAGRGRMPAFATLDRRALAAILAYLRTL